MPVSRIKALHMVDAPRARKKILKALAAADGNGVQMAAMLHCDYQTILRLMRIDPELAAGVMELREDLSLHGVTMRGWGDWHKLSSMYNK